MRITKAITLLPAVLISLLIPPSSALSSQVDSDKPTYTPATVSCGFKPGLSCHEQRSGRLLWSKHDYRDPTPISLLKNRLYISHSTTFSSLDLATGEVIWQVSSDKHAHFFYPVVADPFIYLARSDGRLEKYQADSGALLWSRKLGSGWVYPPLIIENRLISGGQDRTLWVLDPEDGNIITSFTLGQELVSPPFQAGNTIVISTFDSQLQAFLLNPSEREIKQVWRTQLSAPGFSYLYNKDQLFVADMGGQLNAVEPKSGAILWQQNVHHNALYWTVQTHSSLVSLSQSGALSILDIHTGQLQKTLQLQGEYDQAPVVEGDSIVLLARNGVENRMRATLVPELSDATLSKSN